MLSPPHQLRVAIMPTALNMPPSTGISIQGENPPPPGCTTRRMPRNPTATAPERQGPTRSRMTKTLIRSTQIGETKNPATACAIGMKLSEPK